MIPGVDIELYKKLKATAVAEYNRELELQIGEEREKVLHYLEANPLFQASVKYEANFIWFEQQGFLVSKNTRPDLYHYIVEIP